MPIYEFHCTSCGSKFEEILRNVDEARDVVCPACGGDEVERLQSSFSRGGCSTGEASSACSPTGGLR